MPIANYSAFSYTPAGNISMRSFPNQHSAQTHIARISFQTGGNVDSSLWVIARYQGVGGKEVQIFDVLGLVLHVKAIAGGNWYINLLAAEFFELDSEMRMRACKEIAQYLLGNRGKAREVAQSIREFRSLFK